jgi:polysaccharide pyruvyl transferase WcaK-like protein
MGTGKKAQVIVVGLGIMNSNTINSRSRFRLSRKATKDFWVGIAQKLHHDGVNFELFTNGSPHDYMQALRISKAIETHLSISCNLAPQPTMPYELAHQISRYKAIIASRLHAHVIATSYFIPSVGLLWDDKVESFFKETKRPDLIFDDFRNVDIRNIVETLYQVMEKRISESIVREKKEIIQKNIHSILLTIK